MFGRRSHTPLDCRRAQPGVLTQNAKCSHHSPTMGEMSDVKGEGRETEKRKRRRRAGAEGKGTEGGRCNQGLSSSSCWRRASVTPFGRSFFAGIDIYSLVTSSVQVTYASGETRWRAEQTRLKTLLSLRTLQVGQRFSSGFHNERQAQIKAFAAQFAPSPFSHLDGEARSQPRCSADWPRAAGTSAAITMKLLV